MNGSPQGCGRTDMAGITHVCPPLTPPVTWGTPILTPVVMTWGPPCQKCGRLDYPHVCNVVIR